MSHFRATNLETNEVVEYDASLPQPEHYGTGCRLEEVSIAPASPDIPGVEHPVDPAGWRIYVGAFFDRFGAYKVPILASDDLIVQAIIKDASVRKFIGLVERKGELTQMLALLQSKGFAVDVAAILETEPTEEERWNE